MRKKYHLVLAISLLLFACVGCQTEQAARLAEQRRAEALGVLRDALVNETEWVKVHAGEVLLQNGYPENVIEIFTEEEKTAGPKYRIGVWRVLAQAPPRDKMRKKYMDKIIAAFLDKDGPDRLHAIESLAKLNYAARSSEVMELTEVRDQDLQPIAYWVLANSGAVEDETALTQLLDSDILKVPGWVGYAFRYRPSIHDSTFARLKEAALKEPVLKEAKGTGDRIYLLSGAYVHARPGSKEILRKKLLEYATSTDKDTLNELAVALGWSKDKRNIDLAEQLLKHSETDVTVFAADAILRLSDL